MSSFNFLANLSFRNLDVRAQVTLLVHNGEEPVINVDELQVAASDVGDVHVVGRGTDVLQLLLGEDVNGNQVDLSMSVFPSLGS